MNEVIDMIEKFNDEVADDHFASQSSFIHTDNCLKIKIEDLSSEWHTVCDKIGVDYQPLPVYNSSINAVELTEEQISRIYKRYKADFEQFGYIL